MAPKKKQQKQKAATASSSSSSSKPSSKGKPAPSAVSKLQISAENENRLRRLLLNSGRPTPSPDHPAAEADGSVTKAKKAKKLRAVYEKLSCEGFTDEQIERALSALKVRRGKFFCIILSKKLKFFKE